MQSYQSQNAEVSLLSSPKSTGRIGSPVTAFVPPPSLGTMSDNDESRAPGLRSEWIVAGLNRLPCQAARRHLRNAAARITVAAPSSVIRDRPAKDKEGLSDFCVMRRSHGAVVSCGRRAVTGLTRVSG